MRPDLMIPPRSWIHSALELKDSAIHGRAVHTISPITSGEVVIIWGGKVFTKQEIDAGKARQHTIVGISENLSLGNEANQPPGLDDYINHSCDPNIGMKNEITLIAIHDIAASEELTADYAMWLNDESYVMNVSCNCGCVSCRRTITGKDYQKPAVQDRIYKFMSPFLRRKLAIN